MVSILVSIWKLVLGIPAISKKLDALFLALAEQGKAIQSVSGKLDQVLDLLVSGPAVEIIFTATLEGVTTEGVTQMNMTDSQKVDLTIQPVDAKGKPALLDGVPTWASSDETVVTVVAAADGLSATVSAVAMGSARVVVTGDADLGTGVTPITGTLDFTITAGQAISINVTAGTPSEQ